MVRARNQGLVRDDGKTNDPKSGRTTLLPLARAASGRQGASRRAQHFPNSLVRSDQEPGTSGLAGELPSGPKRPCHADASTAARALAVRLACTAWSVKARAGLTGSLVVHVLPPSVDLTISAPAGVAWRGQVGRVTRAGWLQSRGQSEHLFNLRRREKKSSARRIPGPAAEAHRRHSRPREGSRWWRR